MNYIIQLLIDGIVSPEEVIAWINGEDNKSVLESQYSSSDFVPAFLNFIYNQTSRALQICSHYTATPIKHLGERTTKYVSPCKSKNNLSKTKKAKSLDFSVESFKNEKKEGVPSENCSSFTSSFNKSENLDASRDYLPMIEDCQTPVKNKTMIHQTSTPKNCTKVNIEPSPSIRPISLYSDNSLRTYSLHKSHNFSPIGSFEANKNIPFGLSQKISQKGDFHKRPKTHNLADFIVYDKKQGKKHARSENKSSFPNLDHNKVKADKLNLADSEDFPPIGSELKDKKKRIKPTLVSVAPSDRGFLKKVPTVAAQQSNQNAFLVAEQTSAQSLDTERNLLKLEKEKFQRPEIMSIKVSSVDAPLQKLHSYNLPCVENVTSKRQLTVLAQLYALFIMNNFVPNVTTELFYILKLLVIDGNLLAGSLEGNSNHYLVSVHNCVYFSVTVLHHLIDLLSLFDRITLKLLSENSRISLFCFDLNKKLCYLGEHAQPLRIAKGLPKSPILSVSFQSETDNKNNFPSTSAFQVFRKQRDLFYEIIRIWEDEHLNRNWSFGARLGNKIQQVMMLRTDSANYAHFSRLFQSQLLTMCKGDEQTNNLAEFEEVSCLLQLRQSHPERYKRLHERLITPFKVGRPVPPPSFPGYQEFFRNFILDARNHAFYCHLKDCFATMLKQLQSTVYLSIDKDDLETHEDHMRNETLAVLQNLKLIGKFLGLLEFLPYYTSETLTETILASHVQLRNSVCPTLPLSHMLRQACINGCLVVTIPWMVDLLSMADVVAFHTENYLTLSFLLILIYKMIPLFRTANISETKKCAVCARITKFNNSLHDFNSVNILYLKVLLGWLFSLPNFPEGLFYTTLADSEIDHGEVMKTMDALSSTYKRSCYRCFKLAENKEIEAPADSTVFVTPSKRAFRRGSSEESNTSPFKTPSKDILIGMLDTPDKTPMKKKELAIQTTGIVLDSWNLLDHQTLLFSCPYLAELKNILSEFTFEGARSKNTSGIRKITPLTTTEKINDSSTKTLQVQLEENFFHNQPTAVKKTVDFTVDRVFSNILKFARNELVPKLRESCLKELKSSVQIADDWTESAELDVICEELAKEKSEFIVVEIRSRVQDKAASLLAEGKFSAALAALLPSEITDVCLSTSSKIVRRMVLEKVNRWMGNQLVPNFCQKEFLSEAKETARCVLIQQKNTTNVSEPSFNQSLILESISDTLNNSTGILLNIPKAKTEDVSFVIPKIHNNKAPVPSKVLSDIKASLRKLYTSNELCPVKVEEINSLIDNIQATVNGRRDMTVSLFKALRCIYAEWTCALCVAVPDHLDVVVLTKLVQFWANDDGSFDTHDNLLCLLSPKTFMLLGQKADSVHAKAWVAVRTLLIKLLDNKIIEADSVKESVIALMRHSWPQKMLNEISTLANTVNSHSHSSKDDAVESDLLDWVGWVCSEMENID